MKAALTIGIFVSLDCFKFSPFKAALINFTEIKGEDFVEDETNQFKLQVSIIIDKSTISMLLFFSFIPENTNNEIFNNSNYSQVTAAGNSIESRDTEEEA